MAFLFKSKKPNSFVFQGVFVFKASKVTVPRCIKSSKNGCKLFTSILIAKFKFIADDYLLSFHLTISS